MSAIDLDAIEKRAAEAWAAREHPSAGDALALVAEVRALRGVLLEVEWDGANSEESRCGICFQTPRQGHAPDCRLKAALGEG